MARQDTAGRLNTVAVLPYRASDMSTAAASRLREEDAVRLARDLYGLSRLGAAAPERARPELSPRDRARRFRPQDRRPRRERRRSWTCRTPRCLAGRTGAGASAAAAGAFALGRRDLRLGRTTRPAADVPARDDPRRGASAARRRSCGRSAALLGRLDAALAGFSPSGRRRPGPPLGPGARARRSSAATPGGSPIRSGARWSTRFVAEFEKTVAPRLGRASSKRHPQRRQRLQRARRRPVDPDLGIAGRAPGLRRHGRDLDGLRARGGDRLRHLPETRSARRGLRRSSPATTRSAPFRKPSSAVLWPLCAMRLCTSVCPLGASARGRAPEHLPAGQRGARLGGAGQDAGRASAPGALSTARRLRPAALPADAGDRGLAVAPTGARWARSSPAISHAAVVFDLSVGSPVFQSPEQATDVRGDDGEALRRAREAAERSSVSAATTRRGSSTTSDAFAGAERRTSRAAHGPLAIDLFREPGSPVYAPLRRHGPQRARQRRAPRLRARPSSSSTPRRARRPSSPSTDTSRGLGRGPVSRHAESPAGQRIGAIGPPPENGDWPPHVHFQILADCPRLRRETSPAWPRRASAATWLSLCPDPNLILGGAAAVPDRAPTDPRPPRARSGAGASARRSRWPTGRLSRSCAASAHSSTTRPAAPTSTWSTTSPTWATATRASLAAGARQMSVLNTNTRYLHPSILRYAERLTATLPEPLSVCFFVCSGSEANELALRMARAAHGGARRDRRRRRVPRQHAGAHRRQPLQDATAPAARAARPRFAWSRCRTTTAASTGGRIPPAARSSPATCEEAAAAIRAAGGRPAAFLCESLLSCGGQIELPPGYLAAAYRHARDAGAVCIADEVQVGFGRVGTHFWGFETQGVVARHRHAWESRSATGIPSARS